MLPCFPSCCIALAVHLQVKYVGNVHGDEPSGRQLLLMLAEHICLEHSAPQTTAVGSSPSKALLQRVRLFLIPTLNPDGFDAHTRENK
jgi:carboxypeptidase D